MQLFVHIFLRIFPIATFAHPHIRTSVIYPWPLFSIRDGQIYITGTIFRPHTNSDTIDVGNPNLNPIPKYN